MSNKSSSFSSYYYTITDLLNASRIALVYCEFNISPSEMITYNVNDSSKFQFLIRVDKVDGKFVADIATWKSTNHTSEYKFNYILVLGANDVIKAIVSIPDVIDVTEWDTDTITIEFNYNVSNEVLEYDVGTLVSVHISDSIREEVHKGLLKSGATLSSFDVRTQTNPYQYFKNTTTDPNPNDTIHYSGEICRYHDNTWTKISGDIIDISNIPTSELLYILDGKKVVSIDGDTYMIDGNPVTNIGRVKCISNSYIITEVDSKLKLYRFTLAGGTLSTMFINYIKCRYFINSVTNELIFYYDKSHYSRNFKVFELIDDLKSDRRIQVELDSIKYLTNVLYLKSVDNGYQLISYLHNNLIDNNPVIIPSDVAIDQFLTDVLFIGHSSKNGYTEYYLYEDTTDGLKKYTLGIDNYWYNIYLISKCRTNPHISTMYILAYKGLLYYKDNNNLISI